MHKPKNILNNFLLQNRLYSLKNSKNYNFGYNGYTALIKYIYQKLQVRHFHRLQKTLKYENCLNFEKTTF